MRQGDTRLIENGMELMKNSFPAKHGLYDPSQEKDSCGVGFVCDIKGRASNQILRDAEQMNCRMEHRGGVGHEVTTGDGAGILVALPHRLLSAVVKDEFSCELPEPGRYGAGVVFMPRKPDEQSRCMALMAEEIAAEGQRLIGWRTLPVDPVGADLGETARAAMPVIKQVIIAAGDTQHTPITKNSTNQNAANTFDQDAFERTLYLIRKRTTNRLRDDKALSPQSSFYVCSLSSRVINAMISKRT